MELFEHALYKSRHKTKLTSAITSFINFSALFMLSAVPINSTGLMAEWGSASASLII